MKSIAWCIAVVAAIALGGCSGGEKPGDESAAAHEPSPAITNRVAIPAAVRQNLGITFATVERRPVRQTMRFPGEFELRPEARREFRAMAPGRVKLLIKQFQPIEAGTVLFTIDSPHWRGLQHETVEAEGSIKVAQAELDVSLAQLEESKRAAAFLESRIKALQESELRNVELESQLAELRNSLPRREAEVTAKRVELDEAKEHYQSRLSTLASLTGDAVDSLREPAGDSQQPRWRAINELQVRADIAGVVEAIEVTDGGWIETGGLALSIVDPTAIRFRAQSLQSDMSKLSDGQTAHIVLPQGSGFDVQASSEAMLAIGYRASSEQRTIPLYATPAQPPAWAKPGVAGFLEVFIDGGSESELAIPASAIVRDGLVPIVFRRDPANADQAIRMEADLGASDGRWTVVRSGMKQGDQVVLDGAYQLMLASSNASTKGGHFHSDGTFHADDHEE